MVTAEWVGGQEPLTRACLGKGLGLKHLTDLEQTFSLVRSLGHPGSNKCGVNYLKSNRKVACCPFAKALLCINNNTSK